MENAEYKQKSSIVSVRFGTGEVDFLAGMAEQFGFSIGQAVRECVLLKIKANTGYTSEVENRRLLDLTDLVKQGFEIVLSRLDGKTSESTTEIAEFPAN